MISKGKRRLKQVARWFKYRFSHRGIILVYHRITDLPNDPFLLAVKPEHFAQHMEIIRSFCHPTPLHQMVNELQVNKLTNRTVAVTFDDGYADNLQQAKPILVNYDIPATVFITAGQIGSQREFWWDELDRLVLQPGTIPSRLGLSIHGGEYVWESNGMDEYPLEIYRKYSDWHIEREDDPHPRHRLFRDIYSRIHSLPQLERQRVLDEILAWTGFVPVGRESHRSMTSHEVALLEKGGLIEVGDHTMVHADMAALSPIEQRQEIQKSKASLEAILNHPVRGFAYPYGSNTPATIEILREIGFEYACSTQGDAVWPYADQYQLPRLGVRDWNQQVFARFLSWWMDG